MKYLLLLYGDPAAEAAAGPDGRAAMACPEEAIELAKQVPRSPGLVAELSPIADG